MHRVLEKIYYEVRKPKIDFKDIGGLFDVKKKVDELIVYPIIKRKELIEMGLELPKGVILWGPLGVGMTMLTEAAAFRANVTFVYVSGQEVLNKKDALKEAIDAAISEAPCVLYISDCDWIVPRTNCSYEWGHGNLRGKPPTFSNDDFRIFFISEIDRVQQYDEVRLVGGCYRIDVVDQSIIKEKKRFNRKIYVHPPYLEDRIDMLRLYLKKIKNLSEDVDILELAKITEGYVGWDIESLYKKATLHAVIDGKSKVDRESFMKAYNEIQPWLTKDMIEGYEKIYKLDCPHHYTF
jgi:SpoVK/Ycf46/Vps4 family AAA+-type ATPase